MAFIVVIHIGHYLIFRKQRGTIAELERRIFESKNKQPQLDLLFLTDGESSRHCVIEVLPLSQQPDFDELVRLEAEKLEEAFEKSLTETPTTTVSEAVERLKGSLSKRHKSYETYKKECDSYLEQYRRYQRYRGVCLVWTAHFREVNFRIENKGQTPAKDVVVVIHFPNEFLFPSLEEVAEMKDYEDPGPPVRPDPYDHPLAEMAWVRAMRDASLAQGVAERAMRVDVPGLRSLVSSLDSNVSGPFIKSSDSTEISYEIEKLNHGFAEELGEIGFLVTDGAIGHVWELEYSIHADELPEPITDTLLLETRLIKSDSENGDLADGEKDE